MCMHALSIIIQQELRSSGDFLFESNSFSYESDVQNDSMPASQSGSKSSSSSSKGFFKAISSLSHSDLSPKQPSSAHRARRDVADQPGIHTKSFLDTVRDQSRVRSMSPDRSSVSSSRSNRSSSSLSITRTHSNTLARLGLAKSSTKKLHDSPFIDSDDDWDDTLDDFNQRDNATLTPKSTQHKSQDYGIGGLSLKDNEEADQEDYVNINKNGGDVTIHRKEQIQKREEEEEVNELYPFLKKNYDDIVKDPFCILSTQSPPPDDIIKYNKIVKSLTQTNFDLSSLKAQAWGGIPSSLRSLVWQILVGYLSTNSSTRISVLSRKRKEYANSISRLFKSEKDQVLWHQIKIDVLRTNPSLKLYSFETTHRSLEKILYLWAIRHPASGYVQGINDLVTPFFHVFLNHYLSSKIDINEFDPQCLPKELLNVIEADTYWCLTKVLDTIQDNFIHEQPGIIRQINELKNLIKRDEPQLANHFEKENLDFIQFAFRWMNCMLMREFKLNLIIRMWDTYLSNSPIGFSQFHIYVCCAFLRRFSSHIMDMEFQDIIMFLQDTSKTEDWTEDDIEMMLSEAYVWQSLYENASAHLK